MKIVLTYFPYNIFGYVLDTRDKIEGYQMKIKIRLVATNVKTTISLVHVLMQKEENKTTDDLLYTKSALHVVKPLHRKKREKLAR